MPSGIYIRKPMSEETKRKISFIQKGRKHKPQQGFQKGYIPWNKGKKLSPELRDKISKILKSQNKRGENSYCWKGGKHLQKGYVNIFNYKHPFANHHGYVREHRLVVEKNIGRYLKSNEFIHHINGNPSDNRIENLLICNGNQEHRKIHKNIENCLYELLKIGIVIFDKSTKNYILNEKYQTSKTNSY